ncbi:MAG: RDD family protein [Deltaproteobacteria bacterium]|nr:RDD family protein [Deltaproteobacteria bacterium]MBI3293942.1 RDD family protein [Deltaproteobacteria bacterium]
MNIESPKIFRTSSIFLGSANATKLNRFVAKAIDLTMVLIIYLIFGAFFHSLGVIASLVFCAVQDSLGIGQSIGKRMMGIQVLEEPHRVSCSAAASLIRNVPFVLLVLFGFVSSLRFLGVVIAVPLVALEVYLIATLDSGVRLGDILANTLVADYDSQHLS